MRHTNENGPREALERNSEAWTDSSRESILRSILAGGCAPRDDTITWAYDCIQNPGKYGADEWERQMIADLLAQLEAGR